MESKQYLEAINEGLDYSYIGKHNNINHSSDSYLLKWTDGQPYERSRRLKHQIQMEQQEYIKKIEDTAYSSSLHHDENTWEILNQSLSGSGFTLSNKREEIVDKLANREMMKQIGVNPFLSENNYAHDISIRNKFLQPINTNQSTKN